MKMDLIICLEMDEVADEIIVNLQKYFKIANIDVDDENTIRAKIIINGVEDLQELGFLIDDDIVLAGSDMDMVTHRYALKELGW